MQLWPPCRCQIIDFQPIPVPEGAVRTLCRRCYIPLALAVRNQAACECCTHELLSIGMITWEQAVSIKYKISRVGASNLSWTVLSHSIG
jgi:hypothetical protein